MTAARRGEGGKQKPQKNGCRSGWLVDRHWLRRSGQSDQPSPHPQMAVPVLPGEGFDFRTTAKGNPEYKVRPLMFSRLMQRVNVSQDLRQGHVSRLLSTPRTSCGRGALLPPWLSLIPDPRLSFPSQPCSEMINSRDLTLFLRLTVPNLAGARACDVDLSYRHPRPPTPQARSSVSRAVRSISRVGHLSPRPCYLSLASHAYTWTRAGCF